MKKKLALMLSIVVVLTTLFPLSASAASNASLFSKIKAKDLKKYDVALPKGGTKKTEKQISNLLKKIKYKVPGKGETQYRASVVFTRDKGAKKGVYSMANKSKDWIKTSKKKMATSLSESTSLVSNIEGLKPGYTNMYLTIMGKSQDDMYMWDKGADSGIHDVIKHSSSGDTGGKTKSKNYKLYKDKKVLGQKCMVYSFEIGKGKNKITSYAYIARKTGIVVKNVSVSNTGTMTMLTFVEKKQKKSANFYKPPASVNFVDLNDLYGY